MTDYVTLSIVKSRLDVTDTSHDADLSLLITAASAAVDRYCKRPLGGFIGASETRYFDVLDTIAGPLRVARDVGIGTGNGFIVGVPTGYTAIVDIDPLLTVTSVATDEQGLGSYDTIWAATGSPPDYQLLPLNAALDGVPYRQIRSTQGGAHQFPVGQKRLQIVGTWGEATQTPPVIQEATILLTARWFHRRLAPFGVTQDMGAGTQRLPPMDPDICMMLEAGGYVDWFFVV